MEEIESRYVNRNLTLYYTSLYEGGKHETTNKDNAVIIGYLSRIQYLLESGKND